MSVHQVVVVFDVYAPDQLTAGRQVAEFLNRRNDDDETVRDHYDIESWWMPEEPLRSQVDGNDNTEMVLVPAEQPAAPPGDHTVEHAGRIGRDGAVVTSTCACGWRTHLSGAPGLPLAIVEQHALTLGEAHLREAAS